MCITLLRSFPACQRGPQAASCNHKKVCAERQANHANPSPRHHLQIDHLRQPHLGVKRIGNPKVQGPDCKLDGRELQLLASEMSSYYGLQYEVEYCRARVIR